MEVILLKDIINLGKQGEVVDVNAAYARKHLLPKGAAVTATRPGGRMGLIEGFIVREAVVDIRGFTRPPSARHLGPAAEEHSSEAAVGLRAAGPTTDQKGRARERSVAETASAPRPPTVAVKSQKHSSNGFDSVLVQLRASCSEVHEAFPDVTHRELTWRTFQEFVQGPLWAAVERLEDEPYRQQVADVLDAAVSKLDAFQLDERHLSAIDSTLSLLSVPTMSEDAVDACEREWEVAAVTTIPALRASFEEWLTSSYCGIEDDG